MGQDYTDEMVAKAGGGISNTMDGGGWDMFRVGSHMDSIRQSKGGATPLVSSDYPDDVFQSNWQHQGGMVHSPGTPPPSSLECGFYWHKNMALFRHKAATTPTAMPTMMAEYNSLKAKLVALCSNKDGALSDLCTNVLSVPFSSCSADSVS